VLIAMTLIALCIVGVWSGQRFTAAGVQLWGGGSAIDTGDVPVSARHEITVYLENIGTKPISVEEIKTSCRCTDVVPKAFVIPANGRNRVTVTLNLQPSEKDHPMREDWPIEVELFPLVNGHGSVPKVIGLPWVLKARVHSPILLDNPRIVFPLGSLVRTGERLVLADRSQVLALGFTVVSPVSEFDCRAPDDLDVKVSMPDVIPGRGRVHVTPRNGIRLEPPTRALILSGKTREGTAFDLSVTCVLTAVDDLLPDPRVMVLSPSNGAAFQDVRLHSRTGRRFRIGGVSLHGKPIDILGVKLATDHTAVVSVEVSKLANVVHDGTAETASISVTYLDEPAGTFFVPLGLVKDQ
jgi:hypothetical protein